MKSAALVCTIVAVAWTLGCFGPNEQQVFRENLRLPAYFPDYLEGHAVSEESTAGDYGLKPGINWAWEGRREAGSTEPIESPGVMMVQIGAEFDLDMGGTRRSVQVDGVTGWFTRLAARDFYPPFDPDDFLAAKEAWPEEARGPTGYGTVLHERNTPGVEIVPPGTPEPLDYVLWGEAIALQWNRDGVHHLLIAQDIEPMNEDEIFKMANSMTPSGGAITFTATPTTRAMAGPTPTARPTAGLSPRASWTPTA